MEKRCEIVKEMMDYCVKEYELSGEFVFFDLLEYAADHSADRWFPALCDPVDNIAYLMVEYLKGIGTKDKVSKPN